MRSLSLGRLLTLNSYWFGISFMWNSLHVILLPAVSGAKDESVQADTRMRGQANAPVTLIEYSDFTCGYCLKFFKETWPRLQARYVETGKVRFLYKDYPRADQGPGAKHLGDRLRDDRLRGTTRAIRHQ